MNFFKKFYLFLFLILSIDINYLSSMRNVNEQAVELLNERLSNIDISFLNSEIEDVSDSDSEDEEDYVYTDVCDPDLDTNFWVFLNSCRVPEEGCLVFFRGVHFSSLKHSVRNYLIKCLGEMDENYLGLKTKLASFINLEDQILSKDISNFGGLVEKDAAMFSNVINNLNKIDEGLFFSYYKNSYDKFLEQLKESNVKNLSKHYKRLNLVFEQLSKIYQSTPIKSTFLVSASESLEKAMKYSKGEYLASKCISKLSCSYDKFGNLKYPYLGRIYIIVVPYSKIESFKIYFTVQRHLDQSSPTRFDIRKIWDREVIFTSCVPEEYVFSLKLRLPTFKREAYPEYYKKKYGISIKYYNCTRKQLGSKNPDFKKITNNVLNLVVKNNIKKIQDCIEKKIGSVFYMGIKGDLLTEPLSLKN